MDILANFNPYKESLLRYCTVKNSHIVQITLYNSNSIITKTRLNWLVNRVKAPLFYLIEKVKKLACKKVSFLNKNKKFNIAIYVFFPELQIFLNSVAMKLEDLQFLILFVLKIFNLWWFLSKDNLCLWSFLRCWKNLQSFEEIVQENLQIFPHGWGIQ